MHRERAPGEGPDIAHLVEPGELRLTLLAVQKEGSRRLARALKPLELTPLQGEILTKLARSAPLTLSELGEMLVCNLDGPSRAVDRLVKRGAIRRQRPAADRRKIILRLTPAGHVLASQALGAFKSVDDMVADHLDEEARSHTLATLRRLPTGTGEPAPSPPFLRRADR